MVPPFGVRFRFRFRCSVFGVRCSVSVFGFGFGVRFRFRFGVTIPKAIVATTMSNFPFENRSCTSCLKSLIVIHTIIIIIIIIILLAQEVGKTSHVMLGTVNMTIIINVRSGFDFFYYFFYIIT